MLLSLLANRKNLVGLVNNDKPSYNYLLMMHQINGILQHRGAQQAQVSADQIQQMTEEMHEIAKKTKQETVSMRVITSVTLFFLPATFIAVRVPDQDSSTRR